MVCSRCGLTEGEVEDDMLSQEAGCEDGKHVWGGRLIRVTIANIDNAYTAIFDLEDRKEAARRLLKELIDRHGFFPTNRLAVPPEPQPEDSAWAKYSFVLEIPDVDDLDLWFCENENTYRVSISPYEFGEVFE